jgi:hypothetical protein
LLEPSTIRLAYQLCQYQLHKSAFARKSYLIESTHLLEAIVSTYSLPQEFGLKEHYGKEVRAKYPSDWVTDSARIHRACKQLKAEAQELEEYITQDLDPKQRLDKGPLSPKSQTHGSRRESNTSAEYTIPRGRTEPPMDPVDRRADPQAESGFTL